MQYFCRIPYELVILQIFCVWQNIIIIDKDSATSDQLNMDYKTIFEENICVFFNVVKIFRFVQWQKNSAFIGQTPYKAMFGVEPRLGIRNSQLPDQIWDMLETEEQLEEAMRDHSTEMDTENTAPMDIPALTTPVDSQTTPVDIQMSTSVDSQTTPVDIQISTSVDSQTTLSVDSKTFPSVSSQTPRHVSSQTTTHVANQTTRQPGSQTTPPEDCQDTNAPVVNDVEEDVQVELSEDRIEDIQLNEATQQRKRKNHNIDTSEYTQSKQRRLIESAAAGLDNNIIEEEDWNFDKSDDLNKSNSEINVSFELKKKNINDKTIKSSCERKSSKKC